MGGGSLAIIYSMNKINLKIYRFTLVNKNEMTFQKSQNKQEQREQQNPCLLGQPSAQCPWAGLGSESFCSTACSQSEHLRLAGDVSTLYSRASSCLSSPQICLPIFNMILHQNSCLKKTQNWLLLLGFGFIRTTLGSLLSFVIC